jgi:hypothetical protein
MYVCVCVRVKRGLNLILSYLILSYLILSYLILSYLILSYLILSYLILSYLILSYLILSYLILSYLVLSSFNSIICVHIRFQIRSYLFTSSSSVQFSSLHTAEVGIKQLKVVATDRMQLMGECLTEFMSGYKYVTSSVLYR